MAAVARAGEDGLLAAQLAAGAELYLDAGWRSRRGNRPYLRTEHRMIRATYRDRINDQAWTEGQPEYRYHFTDDGRAHYAEHLGAYRELYPDIDAPDLTAAPTPGPAR
jgi:hypothetical protein